MLARTVFESQARSRAVEEEIKKGIGKEKEEREKKTLIQKGCSGQSYLDCLFFSFSYYLKI